MNKFEYDALAELITKEIQQLDQRRVFLTHLATNLMRERDEMLAPKDKPDTSFQVKIK